MGINVGQQFFDSFYIAFQQGDTNLASKSAEADNIRLVERIYRLIAQSDFEALGDTLADDVVFEVVGSPANPLVGCAQGRDQVVEVVRKNFQLLEDQKPEIQSVVAQGDTVVVMARESGRFAPTGKEYDFYWVQFFTFGDGKVIRARELADVGDLT
jgi:ketosteroid isomerase-like protein